LRRLQQGDSLSLPQSRPMPAIGTRCHELRITDRDQTWRIMHHAASDAVVILDVFAKKTEATPAGVLDTCRKRLADYLKSSECEGATMKSDKKARLERADGSLETRPSS